MATSSAERADLPERLPVRTDLRLVVAHVQHSDERDGGRKWDVLPVDVAVAQLAQERDQDVADQTVNLVEKDDDRFLRLHAQGLKSVTDGG